MTVLQERCSEKFVVDSVIEILQGFPNEIFRLSQAYPLTDDIQLDKNEFVNEIFSLSFSSQSVRIEKLSKGALDHMLKWFANLASIIFICRKYGQLKLLGLHSNSTSSPLRASVYELLTSLDEELCGFSQLEKIEEFDTVTDRSITLLSLFKICRKWYGFFNSCLGLIASELTCGDVEGQTHTACPLLPTPSTLSTAHLLHRLNEVTRVATLTDMWFVETPVNTSATDSPHNISPSHHIMSKDQFISQRHNPHHQHYHRHNAQSAMTLPLIEYSHCLFGLYARNVQSALLQQLVEGMVSGLWSGEKTSTEIDNTEQDLSYLPPSLHPLFLEAHLTLSDIRVLQKFKAHQALLSDSKARFLVSVRLGLTQYKDSLRIIDSDNILISHVNTNNNTNNNNTKAHLVKTHHSTSQTSPLIQYLLTGKCVQKVGLMSEKGRGALRDVLSYKRISVGGGVSNAENSMQNNAQNNTENGENNTNNIITHEYFTSTATKQQLSFLHKSTHLLKQSSQIASKFVFNQFNLLKQMHFLQDVFLLGLNSTLIYSPIRELCERFVQNSDEVNASSFSGGGVRNVKLISNGQTAAVQIRQLTLAIESMLNEHVVESTTSNSKSNLSGGGFGSDKVGIDLVSVLLPHSLTQLGRNRHEAATVRLDEAFLHAMLSSINITLQIHYPLNTVLDRVIITRLNAILQVLIQLMLVKWLSEFWWKHAISSGALCRSEKLRNRKSDETLSSTNTTIVRARNGRRTKFATPAAENTKQKVEVDKNHEIKQQINQSKQMCVAGLSFVLHSVHVLLGFFVSAVHTQFAVMLSDKHEPIFLRDYRFQLHTAVSDIETLISPTIRDYLCDITRLAVVASSALKTALQMESCQTQQALSEALSGRRRADNLDLSTNSIIEGVQDSDIQTAFQRAQEAFTDCRECVLEFKQYAVQLSVETHAGGQGQAMEDLVRLLEW